MKELPTIVKIIKRLFIMFISFLVLPVYWIIGIIPRNRYIWVFSSWFGKRYADNSRILFEYVNSNCPEIKAIWLTKNKKLRDELKDMGYTVYHNCSFSAIYYLLRASKIFTTTGKEFSLFFTNGATYYALWHGMPLKKILNDDKKSRGEKVHKKFRHNFAKFYRIVFSWTNMLSQKKLFTVSNSSFFTPILSKAFGIPENKIIETGSPRCDALFSEHEESLLVNIRKKYPDSKIILYMPTFRTAEWTGEIFNPFLEKYGFQKDEFIRQLEKNNFVFLYKPHFYDLELIDFKQEDSRFITISDDSYNELYNFVGQVDILATDYSSIYFDFIATKKSVILLPFDYSDYLSTAREHYYDYSTNIEGVKCENWKQFYDVLEKNTFNSVSSETIKKFSEYIDGNCCNKLIRFIK